MAGVGRVGIAHRPVYSLVLLVGIAHPTTTQHPDLCPSFLTPHSTKFATDPEIRDEPEYLSSGEWL